MSHVASKWLRVGKLTPCYVCHKIDWCCYTEEGVSCCMRVQSHKPAKNGGWIHKLSDDIPKYIPPPKIALEPTIEISPIYETWKRQSTPKSLILFSEKLGIDPMSLYSLGCVWSYPNNAWAFPMRDYNDKIIGIRLRNEVGQKWAVKGSRNGLFIPRCVNSKQILFICEGPTDTAAALCLGLSAIGRPSCLGLESMVNDFIHVNSIKRVVILSDNDEAGINGSNKLQETLKVSSCLMTLPCKDVREFYSNGGTRAVIDSILKNLIWTKK